MEANEESPTNPLSALEYVYPFRPALCLSQTCNRFLIVMRGQGYMGFFPNSIALIIFSLPFT